MVINAKKVLDVFFDVYIQNQMNSALNRKTRTNKQSVNMTIKYPLLSKEFERGGSYNSANE